VDEICHAIAIRIGSNDLDNDDIPSISTLLDCCQGLVTVDQSTSTVRLIHFTLKEHLCRHAELFDRAHSTMAETCLTYLNFQSIKDLPAGLPPDPRDTPFLEYSSLYWGTHMRKGSSPVAQKPSRSSFLSFTIATYLPHLFGSRSPRSFLFTVTLAISCFLRCTVPLISASPKSRTL